MSKITFDGSPVRWTRGDGAQTVGIGELARTDDAPMSFMVCSLCGAMVAMPHGSDAAAIAHAAFHDRVEP